MWDEVRLRLMCLKPRWAHGRFIQKTAYFYSGIQVSGDPLVGGVSQSSQWGVRFDVNEHLKWNLNEMPFNSLSTLVGNGLTPRKILSFPTLLSLSLIPMLEGQIQHRNAFHTC